MQFFNFFKKSFFIKWEEGTDKFIGNLPVIIDGHKNYEERKQ